MKYLFTAFAGFAMLVMAGCQQGTSTAPGTAPGDTANKSQMSRKLTVTSPGSQTVRQDGVDTMTVSISRSHFDTPVMIELRNLPSGVSVETQDLTIPADKTSLSLAIKAAPGAKPMEKHKVTLAAKAKDEKDLPEATVDFDLNVKPKS